MKKVKLNDENIHKGYLILINPDNLLKTNAYSAYTHL